MFGLARSGREAWAAGVVCLDRLAGFEYKARPVASDTKKTSAKRKRRHRNAGRTRKNKLAQRSTLSDAELFAGCGEPGKPAPAAN